MFDDIFSSTKYLKTGLNASMMRGEVIANNIANVNTPDFKASRVEFESMFQEALRKKTEGEDGFAMRRTRPGHLPFGDDTISLDDIEPVVTPLTDKTMRMDGNNVDIDIEASEQAKNGILYQTLLQKLNGEYTRIRLAISGR